ncbi:MAG: anti-sigma factor family protein [Peptococcales bacterium]
MSCHHMEYKIYTYIQGYLAENQKKIVEDHLVSCPQCQKSYLQWKELDACFDALQVEPPQDFTLRIMNTINNVASKKINNYWFANWYKNFGKGLIAAGILGILINCSVYLADIPLENSMGKVFLTIEQIGDKYLQLYEGISFNGDFLKVKGGINNEM